MEDLGSGIPFLQMLDASPCVTVATGSDPTGTPLFVSQNIHHLLGKESRALVEGSVRLWDHIHPDDVATVLVHLNQLSESTTQLPDYRMLRSSDEPLWVSHRIVRHGPELTLHFLEEITERKRVEQDLAFHKERLELVLEGTRLGMWDWNPQTNEVSFNQIWAEMLGYDLSEIEPSLSSWESRVHPDDLADCYADITAHIEGRVPFYENVHRMKHRDGHWVHILDRGKVVERDSQGRPIRFTGTHTDISQQRHAEVEARAAAQAKAHFLANMSHELRGPLNGILGLNNLLADAIKDEELREYIKATQQCGKSMLVIVNEILDFSKIEQGKLVLVSEDFDLHRLVHDVALLGRDRALTKKIGLYHSIADRVPRRVRGDHNRLRQILMNLMTNALKFTNKGEINLSVDLHGTTSSTEQWELEFCVRDTGIGISPQDQDKIFERFVQADQDSTTRVSGTGLGLPISAKLVELFGGRLWFDSRPGEGSEFRFTIRAERAKGKLPPITREIPTLFGVRVLAAEDNPVNQLVLNKTLKRVGAECTLVCDGRDAVEKLRESEYDVIILDLFMPQQGGLETTKIMLQEHGDACPPIVALSADAFSETRRACLDAGMTGFMAKPYDAIELTRVLARAMRRARAKKSALP